MRSCQWRISQAVYYLLDIEHFVLKASSAVLYSVA